MRFIRAEGFAKGVADLSQRLSSELGADKQVLWVISGGSNIPATVQIMQNIPDELTPRLSVMLGDERYGPDGHPDSNWQQLLDQGADFKSAQTVPVLRGLGLSETLQSWQRDIERLFSASDMVLLQLGMGPDGHISGILPDSPAAVADGEACAYQSDPYQRLTLTLASLLRANAAYVFAFGAAKRPQLEILRDRDLDRTEQPAQIIKKLPEAYIYNDQIGEPA